MNKRHNSVPKELGLQHQVTYLISMSEYNKLWNETKEDELCEYLDELNNKGVKFGITNLITHKGKTNLRFLEWSKKYSDSQISFIIDKSPQKHKEAGFDYGWDSRFDTIFKLPMEFGFVKYAMGEPIRISATGHMLIDALNEEEPNEQKIQFLQSCIGMNLFAFKIIFVPTITVPIEIRKLLGLKYLPFVNLPLFDNLTAFADIALTVKYLVDNL